MFMPLLLDPLILKSKGNFYVNWRVKSLHCRNDCFEFSSKEGIPEADVNVK